MPSHNCHKQPGVLIILVLCSGFKNGKIVQNRANYDRPLSPGSRVPVEGSKLDKKIKKNICRFGSKNIEFVGNGAIGLAGAP